MSRHQAGIVSALSWERSLVSFLHCKKNEFAHNSSNAVPILDNNAFAKTVERHPLNTAQWAGTYKMIRKANFLESKTREEKRAAADQANKQCKLLAADKKVEGKGGAAADAIKLQAIR